MILREFKNYLSTTKIANIRELSIYLHAQPDAVRAMAQILIKKHYIRKAEPKNCGKGCHQGCASQSIEIYEWIG